MEKQPCLNSERQTYQHMSSEDEWDPHSYESVCNLKNTFSFMSMCLLSSPSFLSFFISISLFFLLWLSLFTSFFYPISLSSFPVLFSHVISHGLLLQTFNDYWALCQEQCAFRAEGSLVLKSVMFVRLTTVILIQIDKAIMMPQVLPKKKNL